MIMFFYQRQVNIENEKRVVEVVSGTLWVGNWGYVSARFLSGRKEC